MNDHAQNGAGPTEDRETATLAGGCFWCLEAVFEQVRGVESVVSGYAGGHDSAPTYQSVCSGRTGHAEVVQLMFDPAVVSYREILDLFFATHDPTTVDRQGPDSGTQYRSAVYYHSPEQKAAAESAIAELTASRVFLGPIVTEVEQAGDFYPGEAYHQEYYRRNLDQPYCQFIIAPKVAKLRKEHFAALKA